MFKIQLIGDQQRIVGNNWMRMAYVGSGKHIIKRMNTHYEKVANYNSLITK